MTELSIIRNEDYGKLYVNGQFVCWTIEPHILTDGVYTVTIDYSPKFKGRLPHIFNDEFPASRGFRIHAGNTLKDSQGCILVGDMIDYNFKLYNSKKALNRLLNILKENNTWHLTIISK